MSTERAESRTYQLFLVFLSIAALISLAADLLLNIDEESRKILRYADTAVCVVFLADFIRCLWRAEDRIRYFFTWGWLDLLASIPVLDAARWGRLARIARILRVLRGVRAMHIIYDVVRTRRRESAVLTAALMVLGLFVTASLLILQFESGDGANIRSAEDALWWTITTITTVGYGDRYPVTDGGRVVAAVLMTAGLGVFGLLSGLLASWFVGGDGRQVDETAELRQEIQRLREAIDSIAAR